MHSRHPLPPVPLCATGLSHEMV
uniref:Uncharacterized protein n=1 Tax=Oryza nivara TaxID=4536 RepID=A0A0E0GPK7_ORYNI